MDNHKTLFEQTDNTIIKIKRTKKETMGEKKTLHRKLKIEQQEPVRKYLLMQEVITGQMMHIGVCFNLTSGTCRVTLD